MTSHVSRSFRCLFEPLPQDVQRQAVRAYEQWSRDAWHPGLHFSRVHAVRPIYSARIGLHWRAVAVRDGDEYLWFWIGSHAEYDQLLNQL